MAQPPINGASSQRLLDYHLGLLADESARCDKFNAEDADWVRVNFDPFNRLAADSDKFRFALEAAVDGGMRRMRAPRPRDSGVGLKRSSA